MGKQAVVAGGRSARRIAVSVVEDDNVVSLVLPDTLVTLTLGADVDDVADALTSGGRPRCDWFDRRVERRPVKLRPQSPTRQSTRRRGFSSRRRPSSWPRPWPETLWP